MLQKKLYTMFRVLLLIRKGLDVVSHDVLVKMCETYNLENL